MSQILSVKVIDFDNNNFSKIKMKLEEIQELNHLVFF